MLCQRITRRCSSVAVKVFKMRKKSLCTFVTIVMCCVVVYSSVANNKLWAPSSKYSDTSFMADCDFIGDGATDRTEKGKECRRLLVDSLEDRMHYDTVFHNSHVSKEISRSVIGTPLHSLPNYKTPCWVSTASPDDIREGDSPLADVLEQRMTEGDGWRFRCLPYLYILGFPRCGVSELLQNLLLHPAIYTRDDGPRLPEAGTWPWMNRRKKARGSARHQATLGTYLDEFDQAAENLRVTVLDKDTAGEKRCLMDTSCSARTVGMEAYREGVLADASPDFINLYLGWEDLPGHEGLQEPRISAANTIHSLSPQARFIVLLRDPVERAFSDYMTHNPDSTPEDFNQDMIDARQIWVDCRKNNSLRHCLFNSTVFPTERRFMSGNFIRNSMYAPFVEEWLTVFPKEQFIFLKAEDYFADRLTNLKKIYAFLGLRYMAKADMDNMERSLKHVYRRKRGRQNHVEMLEETSDMLWRFFKPYSKWLTGLTKNPRLLWD